MDRNSATIVYNKLNCKDTQEQNWQRYVQVSFANSYRLIVVSDAQM